jgi:hypothetical protein
MIKIEITTIEDLVAFARVIKGEDLDINEIKNLTTTINKDVIALDEAVKNQQMFGGKNA